MNRVAYWFGYFTSWVRGFFGIHPKTSTQDDPLDLHDE